MKVIATEKAEQNLATVDPWTVVHFATGLALGLMNAPLRVWLPAAALYEVAEQYLERIDVGQELFDTSGPEVVSNVIVDLVVFVAGHHLGTLWNRTK